MQQPPGHRGQGPPYQPPGTPGRPPQPGQPGPPGQPGWGGTPPPAAPAGRPPQPGPQGYPQQPGPPGYVPQGAPGGYPQQRAMPPPPPGGFPAVQSTFGSPKKRRSLRFLAQTCVFSAWVTLILSLLGSLFSFVSAANLARMAALAAGSSSNYFPGLNQGGAGTNPLGGVGNAIPDLDAVGEDGTIRGGGGLGGGLGGTGLGGGGAAAAISGMGASFMQSLLPGLTLIGGIFTLVSGIVTFILFLGLGQACYALLDLEDQAHQTNQTLQAIVARLGVGR